jgi:hypothetical protein
MFIDVSEVLSASIIRAVVLMMKAANFYRLHGAMSHKTAIFILAAMST